MYDTSPTGRPELASLIERFWLKLEQIEMSYPNPAPESPSNEGNIWRHLFPIHPLASTDPPSAGRLGRFYDERCVICLEEYKETTGKVLVRWHCDHWFHFMCMRDYVDEPDLIAIRCPVCRKDWKLHSQCGITPESRALDVWDYEYIMGADWIFGANGSDPHPDLSDNYNATHRQMHAMSMLWANTTGYPTVDPNNPFNQQSPDFVPGGAAIGRRRLPFTEMALYRIARRDRNEQWRAAVEAAGGGFYGLDPAVADALD